MLDKILIILSLSIDFLMSFLDVILSFSSKKEPDEGKIEISTKQKILTAVILDVTTAPIVSIKESLGNNNVVEAINIKEISFKDTAERWGRQYSIIYPCQEDWVTFWTMWKSFLN
jgi:hypothetical protein